VASPPMPASWGTGYALAPTGPREKADARADVV
jgi:hypothetical protein